jgi:hypothetical protein
MMTNIFIGNDKLDLFKDESIEVTSSVANINDITKNMTDYSKSFTVPATHINNRIFKHYYDANIDNAFDARIKHDGRIELDGLPFKYGKWKLEKVAVKQGNPYAYTITFFGNLVSLKDKLKNFELKDLNLSAYNHTYNSTNVKTGLTSSLFSGAVVYNLFVKKQLYYRSGSENINTSTLANIAYTGGANTGVNWDLLRPSIQVLKIIEAIETDPRFNVSFTRDFFGTTEFQNLYLWVNNNATAINSNEVRIDITNIGTIGLNAGTIDLVEDTFIPGGKRIYGLVKVTPSAGYENVIYKIEQRVDGAFNQSAQNLTGTFEAFFNLERNSGKKYSWYVTANEEFKFTSRLTIEFYYESYNGVASFPEQTVSANFNLSLNFPKIKLIDFLNGLFKMFKLIVIADEYDNIYIDTFNNYYAQGGVYNISRYVKTDSVDILRGNLLNEIKFNFKEPKTILNNQFKINTGLGYGDEEILLTDDGTPSGTPLEGDSLQIEVPFEQFIYERLPDLNDGVLTNIMYGGIFNDKIEPVSPDLHLFYNINTAIGTKTIGFINDAGVREQLSGNINTPSHSIDFLLPDFNLNFGIENNEWTNTSSEKTLYLNHYSRYIESIFNIKRRSFAYKAILPLRILLKLKLNDILEIKNNYYRIDNYQINLLTREVGLNLINSFDTVINGMSSNISELFADYREQTQSISITNLGNPSFDIVDGTWLSLTYSGSNVYFAFDENDTGILRTTNVIITNTETLQIVEIFVTQYPRAVTADSTLTTADTTLITVDNG